MTRFTSAFAAALIASASFAGAALASDGEYYEGANRRPAQSADVDQFTTRSINEVRYDGDQAGRPVFEKTSRDNR